MGLQEFGDGFGQSQIRWDRAGKAHLATEARFAQPARMTDWSNMVAALARELVAIDSRSSVSNLKIADRVEAELAGFELERVDYKDGNGVAKRCPGRAPRAARRARTVRPHGHRAGHRLARRSLEWRGLRTACCMGSVAWT